MIATPIPTVGARPQESREFSQWHEDSIEHLIRRSGHRVEREPRIDGKTPDLLVSPELGEPLIIECVARLQDPEHVRDMERHGHHICGGNIRHLHQNIYSRIEHKVTKYRDIARRMPYVIALYDASCMNSMEAAVDMALSPYAPSIRFGPDGQVEGKLYNTFWSMPEIPTALFELYPHLSGLLYSRWPREHWYLPNPHALLPALPDPFRFASVPALPQRYHQPGWRTRLATVADDSPAPPDAWLPQLELLSRSQTAGTQVRPDCGAHGPVPLSAGALALAGGA